jgi:biopolymer transport protein ExbB
MLVMAAGTASAAEPFEIEERTLLDNIKAGGLPGYVIVLLALAGVALVVAYALMVRRGALLPPLLVSRLEQALNAGEVEGARELCVRATALRNVLFAGLGRLDDGPEAAARAAHLAAERERLALRRFIGCLLLIAVSAVLVGAFGTVSSLLQGFDKLALGGTYSSWDPFDSYAKALVTSYSGLLVAVLLFPAWWFFSARAEKLAHEIEMTAEDLVSRVGR